MNRLEHLMKGVDMAMGKCEPIFCNEYKRWETNYHGCEVIFGYTYCPPDEYNSYEVTLDSVESGGGDWLDNLSKDCKEDIKQKIAEYEQREEL